MAIYLCFPLGIKVYFLNACVCEESSSGIDIRAISEEDN